MNKVFGLFSGEYSNWHCHGYYTTSEEAEKAAIQLTRAKDEYDWTEDYYVLPLKCLDGTNDIYKGNIIYRYSVVFLRKCSERNKDYTESPYYIDIDTFADDDKDLKDYLKNLGVTESLQNDIMVETHPSWGDILTCIWTNNKYISDNEIIKIAYDMIAKWKAEKNGITI